MTVTIDQIKQLREMTGVSMMSCKTALEEAKGDYDEAITILRKKGEAKAADRAGKATSQGVISIKLGKDKAAIVKLACETDFVARGEGFIGLADSLAEKLLKGEIKQSDRDLLEVKDAVLKMGENIHIEDMALLTGKVFGDYVHSNKKIGVVVVLDGGTHELAREVAMHAAATNPSVINPEEISADLVAKEKEIWAEQLKNEKKPEAVIEKIMIGKEKKFREENALLKQAFVKDNNQTIEQLLAPANAKIVKFVRFAF